MTTSPQTKGAQPSDPREDLNRRQYAAWGVVVQTSNVRAVHVANGLMQLLRLMPSPPPWYGAGDLSPQAFVSSVKRSLSDRGMKPGLDNPARAICVYKSKAGPLRLALPPPAGAPKAVKDIIEDGCSHLTSILGSAGEAGGLSDRAHRALADAINADGKVMVAGGHDPTTSSLAFVGFSDTHTLKGMHAATFLGLLCATPAGRRALCHFYNAARATDDPQASLISLLGLAEKDPGDPNKERTWPKLEPSAFEGAFPIPKGEGWVGLTHVAGEMALNIAQRQERGATKAEMLMSLVDLALLLLSTWMLRWERHTASAPRLLLAVCSQRRTTALRQAISRAQESLLHAAAALNHDADDEKPAVCLIRRSPIKGEDTQKKEPNEYLPSDHALNLAAAGGWLFPLDARGGAPRYLCPGPRQLVTLVHALISPGEELAWSTFADKAEKSVGIALGGADDNWTEPKLRMGGVAATLREAAATSQERLISLGLARRESDNVVIVDGGAR